MLFRTWRLDKQFLNWNLTQYLICSKFNIKAERFLPFFENAIYSVNFWKKSSFRRPACWSVIWEKFKKFCFDNFFALTRENLKECTLRYAIPRTFLCVKYAPRHGIWQAYDLVIFSHKTRRFRLFIYLFQLCVRGSLLLKIAFKLYAGFTFFRI